MEVLKKRCVIVDPGFVPRLIVDIPDDFIMNQMVVMMRPRKFNIHAGEVVDRRAIAFDARVLRRPEKRGEFIVLIAQDEVDDDELRVMFRQWLP